MGPANDRGVTDPGGDRGRQPHDARTAQSQSFESTRQLRYRIRWREPLATARARQPTSDQLRLDLLSVGNDDEHLNKTRHDPRDPDRRRPRREGVNACWHSYQDAPSTHSRPCEPVSANHAALTVLTVNVFAFVLVLSFSKQPVHADLELPSTNARTCSSNARQSALTRSLVIP